MVLEKINEVKSRNFEKSEYRKELNEKIKNLSYDEFHSITLPFTSFRVQKISFEIQKLIRRFCPDFTTNFCFSSIKLKSITSPLLKSETDFNHIACCVYYFKCPCGGADYIGETKKLLELRAFEHRRCDQSHIKLHIDSCPIYKNSIISSFGPNPSLAQKRSFLLSCFSVLEKNITNSYIRKTAEANFINIRGPSLNKQVFHHKMSLLCSCLIKNPDKAIPEGIT